MIFNRRRAESGERAAGGSTATQSRAVPEHGPYDVSVAPEGVERLDLGAMRLPAVEGVEVRVQADPDGTIQQVLLVQGQSALQLGVFAAPRTEGIWDEVREEILESLQADGLTGAEVQGAYGTELHATVPSPDGPAAIRFVGVDGPRWMVRGVYQGAAATDPGAAGALDVCLRELVVDRGEEPRPAKEPLALRLPPEVVESAREQGIDPTTGAPLDPGT
ncbi:hypothetical protein GCM10010123_04710 [Pilimelia anulata]|uniref:DUF3710 domain-containing protein n=1 Tax=Pilimelia anulata TaxID=53371 RepID=A0A8J3F658_9ACTN|nr:DUF3710 domain-containing protein [Pilimelia anulata]GGJ77722.1 hypothetical protein GCM10010123_04710 [Pilimelia anulata]